MWVWCVVAFMYLLHLVSSFMYPFIFNGQAELSVLFLLSAFTSIAIFIALFALFLSAFVIRYHQKTSGRDSLVDSSQASGYVWSNFGGLIKFALCFVCVFAVAVALTFMPVLSYLGFSVLLFSAYAFYVALSFVFVYRKMAEVKSFSS